jgi:hypothetical protein
MKRIISCFFLTALFVFVSGCAREGYFVTLNTNQIGYGDLKQIESKLLDEGYKVEWEERAVKNYRYPGEVYTLLHKLLKDKPFYWVDIYLLYVRESKDNLAFYPRIDIGNIYQGLIIPDVKIEIDRLGDSIYREIADKVGEEKVKIERRAVVPPVFTGK